MTTVHAVLPDGIEDPARPSGGNVYDRNVCRELAALGCSVRRHPVPGFWARPDAAAFAHLEAAAEQIPDGGVALVDGLIASTAPELLVPLARRVRLAVLIHMPLGHRPDDGEVEHVRTREGAVLTAAAAVITTSAWTAELLRELYALPAERLHVAQPGVEAIHPTGLAQGTPDGGALLCVAAVTYDKGHDVLLEALTGMADLTWDCVCVGRLDRDPPFVEAIRRRARAAGLQDRVHFTGPRTGAALAAVYAAADVMVLPSRAETYGMVIGEALAYGVPVVAADVGGIREAVGHGAGQARPALLTAPGDPAALGAALRAWLSDAALRARLRDAARERRASLPGWPATASVIAAALDGLSR